MDRPLVLIAEQSGPRRAEWKNAIIQRGLRVRETQTARETMRRADASVSLLVIGLLDGDPESGLRLVQEIRRSDDSVPIILMMERSSEQTAVAALRAGVRDYFSAPYALDEFSESVCRLVRAPPAGEVLPGPEGCVTMLGESVAIRQVRSYISNVAAADSNVLITGETGTGKELAARLVHQTSHRRQKPFVCINCAALPEGLLESELFGYERGAFTGAQLGYDGKLKQAHGGTVFFDEIGDMTPYAQAKILRAIEQKQVHHLGGRHAIPVDIRVVAATNQDLEALCAENKFRKDLYFRLNVARVHLPPLRERQEDISYLVKHYLDEMNARFRRQVEGFTDEALGFLLRYPWPGNVRELKNLMEAIFVNLPPRRVSVADLPEQFRHHLRSDAMPQSEREKLLVTLLETNWNKSSAAQKLHWSRMTLYRKMAKYQISSSSWKSSIGNPA